MALGARPRALLDVGYVKAKNFKNSDSKQAYLYQLTPQGIAEKAKATARFLIKKQAEFEQLAQEIAELRREAADITKNPRAVACLNPEP